MSKPLSDFVALFSFTLGTALLGHSVATVAALETWPLALGGAISGAISFGVVRTFRPRVKAIESTHGKRLLGLRIATFGFFVALLGWLLAVYFSSKAGFWVIACGIGIGFSGIATHMVMALRREAG